MSIASQLFKADFSNVEYGKLACFERKETIFGYIYYNGTHACNLNKFQIAGDDCQVYTDVNLGILSTDGSSIMIMACPAIIGSKQTRILAPIELTMSRGKKNVSNIGGWKGVLLCMALVVIISTGLP